RGRAAFDRVDDHPFLIQAQADGPAPLGALVPLLRELDPRVLLRRVGELPAGALERLEHRVGAGRIEMTVHDRTPLARRDRGERVVELLLDVRLECGFALLAAAVEAFHEIVDGGAAVRARTNLRVDIEPQINGGLIEIDAATRGRPRLRGVVEP